MADIEIIKKLRDETGVSIGKCKEALEEAGDIEKARELLKQRGAAASAKKADRTLGAGVVEAYIHNTHALGTMIELLCETDFVAKNEDFIKLAREIAIHTTAMQPTYASRESIPTAEMEAITKRCKEDIDTSKPADIQEKILQGKVDAHLKEIVLVEQPFFKDETKTIKSMIDEAVQKFGERIEVGEFTIYRI